MKKLSALLLCTALYASAAQPAKLIQDRDAIKSMAGCYTVSFEFAETFSPDTAYKLHHPHKSGGLELVAVVEESDKKIVLQHLLIASDTSIIKHWRQDWVYENTDVFQYDRNNSWKKVKHAPRGVKGQWTQKVYQVDDSPRYEGTATWVHVDGRHSWESTADAPLPRREFTTRDDYNVLRRRNRMYMTEYGWMFEQDNQKIVRTAAKDSLVVWEKGFEKFTRVEDSRCLSAVQWWKINQDYWADVRAVWSEVYAANNVLKIAKKIDNMVLWQKLFALGDEVTKSGMNDSRQNRSKVRAVIEQYMNADKAQNNEK